MTRRDRQQREIYLREDLAGFWQPVPHEADAQRRYLQLARVSLRFLDRYGNSFSSQTMAGRPYHHPHFAFGFAHGFPDIRKPGAWSVPPCPRLAARWTAWGEEYEAILKRNPILELRETLSEVSEAVCAESWPYGYEDGIRQWVDAGAPMPCESRYFGFAMTQEIADSLTRLRPQVAGWWYWDDAAQAKVFRPEPEIKAADAL